MNIYLNKLSAHSTYLSFSSGVPADSGLKGLQTCRAANFMVDDFYRVKY